MFSPLFGKFLRCKWLRVFQAAWRLSGESIQSALPAPAPNPTTATATPPAQPTPFLVQWLHSQPPENRIFITVDSASGEMVSLASYPQDELPAALDLALTRSPESDWQPFEFGGLLRRDFEPAKLLDKKQDALAVLEAIVSCRLVAISEMRVFDQEMLDELAKLGVYFRNENPPPTRRRYALQKCPPQ